MLLAEVMVILQNHAHKTLSIVDEGKVIGRISLAELEDFLNEEVNGQKLYYYKLNFELGSAIEQMRRSEIRNKALEYNIQKKRYAFLGKSGYSKVGAAVLILAILGISVLLFNRYASSPPSISYQTITTPKGKVYRITLIDGSKIWLNAASSIRIPLTFRTNERMVILKGQAYFEVAKQDGAPFQVETGEQTVEVLGTHFDVNAYDNEKGTTTTLLEGSVKVTPSEGESDGIMLKPGEQSVLIDQHIDIKPVDAEAAMDWTKGEFSFRNESLEKIMRVIERWYDVEVIFEDEEIRQAALGGAIVKKEGLPVALRLITLSHGVHFTVKGRQVFVNK